MTVGKLISDLLTLCGEREAMRDMTVFLARDAEGNGYSVLYDITTAQNESLGHGRSDMIAKGEDGYIGDNSVILWPVR